LLKHGAELSVYDPAGMENARKFLGEKGIIYAGSAKDCLRDADFCILATPWNEFKDLQPHDFNNSMKHSVLLDCWKIYEHEAFSQKMDYTTIGFYRGT